MSTMRDREQLPALILIVLGIVCLALGFGGQW